MCICLCLYLYCTYLYMCEHTYSRRHSTRTQCYRMRLSTARNSSVSPFCDSANVWMWMWMWSATVWMGVYYGESVIPIYNIAYVHMPVFGWIGAIPAQWQYIFYTILLINILHSHIHMHTRVYSVAHTHMGARIQSATHNFAHSIPLYTYQCRIKGIARPCSRNKSDLMTWWFFSVKLFSGFFFFCLFDPLGHLPLPFRPLGWALRFFLLPLLMWHWYIQILHMWSGLPIRQHTDKHLYRHLCAHMNLQSQLRIKCMCLCRWRRNHRISFANMPMYVWIHQNTLATMRRHNSQQQQQQFMRRKCM